MSILSKVYANLTSFVNFISKCRNLYLFYMALTPPLPSSLLNTFQKSCIICRVGRHPTPNFHILILSSIGKVTHFPPGQYLSENAIPLICGGYHHFFCSKWCDFPGPISLVIWRSNPNLSLDFVVNSNLPELNSIGNKFQNNISFHST